jgi:hypothetical protein
LWSAVSWPTIYGSIRDVRRALRTKVPSNTSEEVVEGEEEVEEEAVDVVEEVGVEERGEPLATTRDGEVVDGLGDSMGEVTTESIPTP